ncbi:hypothetical protein QNM99_05010 [Pseudomonas sp. PCH446]
MVAGLPAYRSSQLEVDTRSLPRRIDLRNGTKNLEAGRGSFNRLDFTVVKVRRLLLKVSDENAEPLPRVPRCSARTGLPEHGGRRWHGVSEQCRGRPTAHDQAGGAHRLHIAGRVVRDRGQRSAL